VWGGEVALGHGSDVFSIALGAEQGLVVWEGLDKKRSRGVIFGASFKRDDLSKVESRGVLSAEHGDFESPSLAVRPGGFWLASIERLSSSRDAAVSSREKKRSDSGDDEAPLVQSGPSVLQVVALDPAGAPLGGPVRITAPESRILVYDLASLPDGSGLLGWRAVDFAPGTEASSVQICRVAPDGSVKKYTVEADNLGAGAPSFLAEFEPGTKPKATAWLALGGRIDATRIMALGPLGDPLDELAREAVLRGSDPIALGNGRMLVARPRGATVELSVLMCEPGGKSH
jgi:hypothetical protein